MESNYMQDIASSGEIIASLGMCFVASVAIFMVLDFYASKKLGGKRMLGYKVLRIPRFFSLVFASAYTIVMFLLGNYGIIKLSYSALTYVQLPYFVLWIYFMITVLRRVRAETKGRSWN